MRKMREKCDRCSSFLTVYKEVVTVGHPSSDCSRLGFTSIGIEIPLSSQIPTVAIYLKILEVSQICVSECMMNTQSHSREYLWVIPSEVTQVCGDWLN